MSHRANLFVRMTMPTSFKRIADGIDRINTVIARLGDVVRAVYGDRPVCHRGDALCVRRRFNRPSGSGALCAGGFVSARRGLDAANRRSCAHRCFLCAGAVAHAGARRSLRRAGLSDAVCRSACDCVDTVCRAFVGYSRTFARGERPAVCLSAQIPHPFVCCPDRTAGRVAGAPCGAGFDRSARPPATILPVRGRG